MISWRKIIATFKCLAIIFTMLAAGLLSACGGNSSGQHHTQPIINDSSAPDALSQATHSFIGIPLFIMELQLQAASAPLFQCHSGTVSLQRDNSSRVTEMLYDGCQLDFPDARISASFHGGVGIEYNDAGIHTRLTGHNFVLAADYGDARDYFIFFNGTLDMDGAAIHPASYTANGDYQSKRPSGDTERVITMQFNDFQRSVQSGGAGLIEHLSGRLNLPGGAGQITLSTSDSGLEREQESACAVSGSLFIEAEDGSSVTVHFDSHDHIRMVVNGRVRPAMTCEKYLELIRH